MTVVVFDKTGTLTIGRPAVGGIRATPGRVEDDVLALAAAVERGSGHLLARTLVGAAEQRRVPPALGDERHRGTRTGRNGNGGRRTR